MRKEGSTVLPHECAWCQKVSSDHLAPFLEEVFLAAGDGVRLVTELSMHRRRRVELEVPRASAIAALAAARHIRSPIDEVDVLEPLYVRPPDVTLPKGIPGFPRRNEGPTK